MNETPRNRSKTPWTPAHLDALRAHCRQPLIDWPAVAAETGHSLASCKTRASTLGLLAVDAAGAPRRSNRHRNPWTPAQTALLRECVKPPRDWDRAMRETGRSLASCRQQATRCGFMAMFPAPARKNTPPKKTVAIKSVRLQRRAAAVLRPCLCCRRTFRSQGAHNRLCDPCRHVSTNPFDL